MTLIVNLSSIFKLKHIIPDGLSPFVKLCNDYSKSRCLCSKTLFGMSNYLWVFTQYCAHQKLFDDYKLGKIDTDQFLDSLLNVFSFLKDHKKVEDPKKKLADAWNEIISWDNESTFHLKQLLDRAHDGEAIYLISNTNPLHIERILSFFEEHFPDVKWNKEALTARARAGKPIPIAPGIDLCLSYIYGSYKEGTPDLLRLIMQREGEKGRITTVISQYPKDLEMARKLHLRTQTAYDFYTPAPFVFNPIALI